MFRSDWEMVSPSSWLTDFADEEAFFSGRDLDLFGQPTASTTMYILLPESTQPGRRGGRSRRSRRLHQQQQRGPTGESMETEKTPPSTIGNTQAQPPAEAKDEAMQEDETARVRDKLLHEDFFADLPLGARAFETQMPPTLLPPKEKTKDGYGYLTYAYSSCATLDDKGETVESTRRRYEDSAGVMKAMHRRMIGDRAMESTWLKTSATDKGKHNNKISKGDVQEFEREWCTTPFGVAEKHALEHGEKKQSELPDAPPPQEIP